MRNPLWDKVIVAHRRYTRANGDALAGALTYAMLVGTAPAVLLAATGLSAVGTSAPTVARELHRAATGLLPGVVAAEADAVHPVAVPVRLTLLVALCWTSLRLVRAARTGIRAMCGQNAGSGNPVLDALRDGVLGLGLIALAGVLVVLTAQWGVPAGIPALWLGFTVAMLRGSWPGTGRPSSGAALRSSLVAALLVTLLTALAGWYFRSTQVLHRDVYQAAGNLVGALVWTSLACRIFLRATAWASTATPMSATPVVPSGPLWVVVPAYNEADRIGDTLRALAAQTDTDFTLLVVDNGSTDDTAGSVMRFGAGTPFPVHVVSESERGAGAAADTGFRYAIGAGAVWLARTDADCLPAPDWVATAKRILGSGAEMVCGRSVPRRDERPTLAERFVFPAIVRAAGLYGRYRRAHRDPRYRTPYVLCHGHNIAITADLYERCGGTARIPLRERSEDLTLLNRAREHSDRIVRAEDLVVENSLRRLRAWGARKTVLWYWDRRYRPADDAEVHVR